MDIQNKITEKEILESLIRSGYLFESEITKQLVDYGFFVESNVSSLDPLTGKAREIDLIAEYDQPYDPDKIKNIVRGKIKMVFEIKNNNTPFVLLTKFENSPDSIIYTGLKIADSVPDIYKRTRFTSFLDILYFMDEKEMYTQYCSFSKKKNEELMAHHPDNVYSSLLKLAFFCEEKVDNLNENWSKNKQEYYRSFLYLPILLIHDDLYELEILDDNSNKLKKVECSKLIFNYHYKQEPQTAIIYVVTKAGFDDFLRHMIDTENQVEGSILIAIQNEIKGNKDGL